MNKTIKVLMASLGILVLYIGIQARFFNKSDRPIGPIEEPLQERLDGYDKAPQYDPMLTDKFINSQDLDTVKLLVENDSVDVNAADFQGNTALHNAAERGDYDMVEYLLVTGKANPRLKNNEGKTPKDLAELENHDRVIFLLISADEPHYMNGINK